MNIDKAMNVECYEAHLATTKDLLLIRRWLKTEYDEHGHGFFCNWRIIEEAFAKKRMTVLAETKSDLPVAYAILNGEIVDILWVKPDVRCKGFGNKLVNEISSILKKRRKAGILLTHVLDQSVDFWRKCGFSEVLPEHSWGLRTKESGTIDEMIMMKIFDAKRRSVSAGHKRIKVQIEFLYDHWDTNQYESYGAVGTTMGIQSGNNCIKLMNDFTCLISFGKSHHTQVRIRLDDEIVINGMPLQDFCLKNKINMKNTQFFTMRSFHLDEQLPEIPAC